MNTPTSRTLQELKKQKIPCQVVERFNPYAKVRVDLFGIIDIVYLNNGIVGIQATSGSNHSARKEKILASKLAKEWIISGGKIEIWSWRKLKLKKGGKVFRWTPRIEEIKLEDF